MTSRPATGRASSAPATLEGHWSRVVEKALAALDPRLALEDFGRARGGEPPPGSCNADVPPGAFLIRG